MRISDWSSDVCSSDLGIVRGPLHRRHSCSSHASRGTSSCCQASVIKWARSRAPTFLNALRRWVLTVSSDRKTRSEEHTSELQSLMRISYAVFCLKKKPYHKRTSSPTNKKSPSESSTTNNTQLIT